MPWTSIDAARYDRSGDLSQLVVVADSRYQGRVASDQEFSWLLNDIEDFNEHYNETSVSLLESVGREKMKEAEEKKAKRKAQRVPGGPLLAEDDVLTETIDLEVGDDLEAGEGAEGEAGKDEDPGPDLLLREAARIVTDMVVLGSDVDMLEQQFAQISEKLPEKPKLEPTLN